MKRGDKVKLEVVKASSHLKFVESLGRRGVSVYVLKLTEALNSDSVVQIDAGDAYMKHQLNLAAKKLQIKLLYALDGKYLFIRPVLLDGELKRLMLWLREPRTSPELESKKFELHLSNSLASLARDAMAHCVKDKWVLTDKGKAAIA